MSGDVEFVMKQIEEKISEISSKNDMKIFIITDLSDSGGSVNAFLSTKNGSEYDTINEIKKEYLELFEKQLKKRGKYRKNEELPFPELDAHHESNRVSARFQARIDRKLAKLVDEFHENTGISKKDITEQALSDFLTKYSPSN